MTTRRHKPVPAGAGREHFDAGEPARLVEELGRNVRADMRPGDAEFLAALDDPEIRERLIQLFARILKRARAKQETPK